LFRVGPIDVTATVVEAEPAAEDDEDEDEGAPV